MSSVFIDKFIEVFASSKTLGYWEIEELPNEFWAIFTFLSPLKTQKIHGFSDVFRVDKKKPVARIGIRALPAKWVLKDYWRIVIKRSAEDPRPLCCFRVFLSLVKTRGIVFSISCRLLIINKLISLVAFVSIVSIKYCNVYISWENRIYEIAFCKYYHVQ